MRRTDRRNRPATRAVAPAARPGTEGVPRLWSLGVALLALAVYLVQCPPVSGDKDSAEFTLVLALNGVAHPTGYPLFTLFGHLFVSLLHALGVGWERAANSWTSLGGAVAMYLFHRLALGLIPPAATWQRRTRFMVASLPVGLFAFNPIWTYETSLAEVYGWHLAWVLGAALYFVHLSRALAGTTEWPARRLYTHAAAWGLLCGVGGAHHVTAVFVAAPLSIALFVVVLARRRLRAGLVPVMLLAACVPLLSYGIILWRSYHPATVQWPLLTPGWPGLLTHVSGREYALYFGGFAPSVEQWDFLRWYVFPFLLPGLAALLGAALAARGLAARTHLWALFASAVLGTANAFVYSVPDPSSYFLHPMTFGLAAAPPVLAWLAGLGRRGQRAALAAGALLGLAAVVLWVPWLRTGQKRVGLFVGFDREIHSMWQSIPMDSAIVFWTNDMYYKLYEYQMLDHEKPGIDVEHALGLFAASRHERFVRRFGVDPVAGVAVRVHFPIDAVAYQKLQEDAIDRIEARVNALVPLPVIHFDPGVPTVRLLRKHDADSTAAPTGTAGRRRRATAR